jgi:hypothetical protein
MPPTIGAAVGFITSEPTPVFPQDRHQTGHHGGDGHEFGTQATNRAFNCGVLNGLVGKRCLGSICAPNWIFELSLISRK